MGGITKEEAKRREELFKNGIKVCSRCKQELPFEMFSSDSTTKTGLSAFCKECQKEQRSRRKDKIDKWFEENQEHVKEYRHEYSKTHSAEKKAYNDANKEYFKQKRKEYEQANPEKMLKKRQKYRHSLSHRYKKYERGAKERGLIFTLSLEEFDNITKQPCFYCGDLPEDQFGNKFTGVDRIDSNEGYELDNVIPCCFVCNRMKSDYDLLEWTVHLQKIFKTLKEGGLIPEEIFN